MSKDALKKRVSHSLSPLHNTAGKSLKPIWFWWQESWNRYSALFKADLLQFFLKTQNEGLPLILHPLPTETNPEFQTAYILSLLAILPPSSSPSTPPFINLVPSRCLGLNSHASTVRGCQGWWQLYSKTAGGYQIWEHCSIASPLRNFRW